MFEKYFKNYKIVLLICILFTFIVCVKLDLNVEAIESSNIIVIEDKEIFTTGKVDYNIKSPKLSGLQDKNLEQDINKIIHDDITFIKKDIEALSVDDHEYAELNDYDLKNYRCKMDYDIKTGKEIMSIVLNIYKFTGGNYEIKEKKAYNIDLKKNKLLTLKDLVSDEECRRLKTQLRKEIHKSKDKYYIEKINSNENFNFYCDGKDVVIYFDMNDIGPYTLGIPQFKIPLKSI
ncbi:DUF3298 and DUF4163 domain-containing protein [Clostridium sp. CTA-19]